MQKNTLKRLTLNTKNTLKILTLCLACVLLTPACGDSEESTSSGGAVQAGGACESTAECVDGLVCVAKTCQDPNNQPGEDTGVGTDTGTGDDVENDVATDTGTDIQPDVEEDTQPDIEEDTQPDVEEDVPVDVVEDTGGPQRPAVLTGGVAIFETSIVANGFLTLNRGNAAAAFTEPTTDPDPISTIGDCDVIAVDPNASNTAYGYDAGLITLDIAGRNVSLTPSTAGNGSVTYDSGLGENNENIIAGGDTINIQSAGGAHIGAFQNSITVPQEHTISSPRADSRIPSNTDLPVSWSPSGTNTEVFVSVTPLDSFFTPIQGQGLACRVSGDTGTFTIPSGALTQTSGQRLAITIIKTNTVEQPQGDDTLFFNVTYAAGVVVQK